MNPTDIRFEQPHRSKAAFKLAAAREHTDRTTAFVVMGLSLACTAMAMFDLLLLASGH